ncbi:LytR/AlgR family response regulator transcription factor [Tunicatimonas pelagia]|uniref:LytR/AlgR family response regulator transcription factor n=1 Tax=Tunicatimonas pelagia TaxID=931531 RepID=UPI002664F186|nr:LytTR family DNA-binding domain-containing protein [Tunicatimonas pelagia]WKN43349.1 LytTR family DNA-binding domain-containing protein [Tunicatimonas pelagia]
MSTQNRINCLVVDDEPLAARLLTRHIDQFAQLNLVATCENALEAFDILQKESVDLLFLDIQMPGIDGLRFARSLQHPPSIIFTTAYRDYAVESYELDVVDYLLKPITIDRFLKSITKYLGRTSNRAREYPKETATDGEASFMYVNTNRKFVKIQFDDVLYVESLKDYVKIHLRDQDILTKEKISEFEQKLPVYFLRIHRSYIVNSNKVSAYTMHDIEIDGKEIPIGVSYKKEVVKFLRQTSTR